MSDWVEVIGWCLIALGAWLTFTAARTLAQLIALGNDDRIEPTLRLQA